MTDFADQSDNRSPSINLLVIGIFILNALTLLIASYLNNFSWDEGWNIGSAKTWAEFGIYGRRYGTQIIEPGLANGVGTVVFPFIAIKLGGMFLETVRLPTMLVTFAGLVIFFMLTSRLLGKKPAATALLLLIPVCGALYTYPMIIGAEAIGEGPLLFFLSTALVFLYRSLNSRQLLCAMLSGIFFGLAVFIKIQALPFVLFGIIAALIMCAINDQKQSAVYLALIFISILLVQTAITHLHPETSHVTVFPNQPVASLSTLAFNSSLKIRLVNLHFTLVRYLPSILAILTLLYIGFKNRSFWSSSGNIVMFVIAAMCLSWFGWFAFCALELARHVAPSAFFSVIPLAWMLHNKEFPFLGAVKRVWRGGFRSYKLLAINFFAFALIFYLLILGLGSPFVVGEYLAAQRAQRMQLLSIVDRLTTSHCSSARIESYESPLLFLSQNPITYPPDSFSLYLISGDTAMTKAANPEPPAATAFDILILGPAQKFFHPYPPEFSASLRAVFSSKEYSVMATPAFAESECVKSFRG